MSALVEQAKEHWPYPAPLLSPPTNEIQYNTLVEALDEIQAISGYDCGHPLDGLADAIALLIEAYDLRTHPMRRASGIEVLRSFMEEHQLTQGDLPELGNQSTVSQLLAGKRKLSVRQVQDLAKRFGVTAETFLG
ncbi:helix-turn-helix domain-containing protein [Pseudomonas sp. HR96]|uniref:helix-turn-helix domain-containing protein n=1 Tax=Pseudomonas sp. HR96 TaxID=1027966 RepID=UPI002A760F67|nr:helix-turn-helix domain-containing protein [Pseudomonas sp. HR96]WPP01415.1 helix-turn-helix domain-containing protein [Pseudomonas sp. HR96]